MSATTFPRSASPQPATFRRRATSAASVVMLSLTALVTMGSTACKTGTADGATPESSASTTTTSASGATKTKVGTDPGQAGRGTALTAAPGHELAIFAEGCFWGSENTYRHVPGVTATAVGYTGGHTEDPSYEDVCTHTTGHAEAVLVEYDPKVVTYADLVSDFWKSHDPTTKNRQGPDIGTNYRSAIFTLNPEQAKIAQASMQAEQTRLGKPITTEIAPLTKFWKAEEYHQQYDEKSGRESCPIFLAQPSKAS